jgi:hypothetical protein
VPNVVYTSRGIAAVRRETEVIRRHPKRNAVGGPNCRIADDPLAEHLASQNAVSGTSGRRGGFYSA